MLEHFIQDTIAGDASRKPSPPPKLHKPLSGIIWAPERHKVTWLRVKAEKDFTKVVGKWHTVNHSCVAMLKQSIARQADLRQAVAELSHERVYAFAEDAVDFPTVASTAQECFQVVNRRPTEMV